MSPMRWLAPCLVTVILDPLPFIFELLFLRMNVSCDGSIYVVLASVHVFERQYRAIVMIRKKGFPTMLYIVLLNMVFLVYDENELELQLGIHCVYFVSYNDLHYLSHCLRWSSILTDFYKWLSWFILF